ncbi:dihydroneopterin triphosphate diphosphatase [Aliiglaciecola sp. CAU 1673]|uniref:dihydroneopterin triphosphate diphosphatase n=1 Tax=Aliiglaciecola sp. CAU 1673 TaxID=3032595 RepID=UPI0023DB9F8F|nr:dihydroneopterin triphosphate diphosphatase [Aliiglaciecola sp. CAU 1673]MDF2177173.1 dihydroneopterin triphosphate diphosphatase [Aliiglaciecola sp. CAU 1673]
MPFKRPESVLVVIYDDDHQVLMLQRLDDPHFWQSVTGSLEAGETPFQTALREVNEEVGIDIEAQGYALVDCRLVSQYAIREAWRYRYAPEVTVNTEYLFALKVKKGQAVELSEHSQYRWLPAKEAAALAWSPTNQEAILRLLSQETQES